MTMRPKRSLPSAFFLGALIALSAGCSRSPDDGSNAPPVESPTVPASSIDRDSSLPEAADATPMTTDLQMRAAIEAAGWTVLEQEEQAEDDVALPRGTERVAWSARLDAQQAEILLYRYPTAGYTGPHLRDVQDRAQTQQAGMWAEARDRELVVVRAATAASARALAEALVARP